MNTKNLVLVSAVLGGLLSIPAMATTTVAHHQSTSALKFEAPVPVRVVPPTGLPRSHEGATIILSLTVDAAGRPDDIKIVSRGDQGLSGHIVPAVSQWRFTPARKNGIAVTSKVMLPLELVDANGS